MQNESWRLLRPPGAKLKIAHLLANYNAKGVLETPEASKCTTKDCSFACKLQCKMSLGDS